MRCPFLLVSLLAITPWLTSLGKISCTHVLPAHYSSTPFVKRISALQAKVKAREAPEATTPFAPEKPLKKGPWKNFTNFGQVNMTLDPFLDSDLLTASGITLGTPQPLESGEVPGKRRTKRSCSAGGPNAAVKNIDADRLKSFVESQKGVPNNKVQDVLNIAAKNPKAVTGTLGAKAKLKGWFKKTFDVSHLKKVKNLKNRISSGTLGNLFMGKNSLKNVAISPKISIKAISGTALAKKFNSAVSKVQKPLMAKELIQCAARKDVTCLATMGGMMLADGVTSKNKFKPMVLANKVMNKLKHHSKVVSKISKGVTKIKKAVTVIGGKAATFGKSAMAAIKLPGAVAKLGKLAGGAMKKGLPFVGVAFSGWALIGSINSTVHGDKEAIADIVENSISVATGTFMAFSAVLKTATPVGTAVAVAMDIAVAVGVGIYKAVKKVEKLDKAIKLTGDEKFEAGLRAFLGMPHPGHLITLLGVKETNDRIVLEFIDSMKSEAAYPCYIGPSAEEILTKKPELMDCGWFCTPFNAIGDVFRDTYDRTYEYHANSYVDLDFNQKAVPDRAAPNDSHPFARVFCAPMSRDLGEVVDEEDPLVKLRLFFTGEKIEYIYTYRYYCQNAIGLLARDPPAGSNSCLFNLQEGHDTAYGHPDRPNVFRVMKGHKRFYGKSKDDTFILESFDVSGVLDGGSGINTLVLAADGKGAIVNLDEDKFIKPDLDPPARRSRAFYMQSLWGGALVPPLALISIQVVTGVKDQGETIHAACDTQFIDGQGGTFSDFDNARIPAKSCPFNIQVNIQAFTQVNNRALAGSFSYHLPRLPADQFSIDIYGLREGEDSSAGHLIFFKHRLTKITELTTDPRSKVLKVNRGPGTEYLSYFPLGRGESDGYVSQPQFFTLLDDTGAEEAEIKVRIDDYEIDVIHRLGSGSRENSRSGFPSSCNIFIISGGHWIVEGGQKLDKFTLVGTFTGEIDGAGGSENWLIVEETFQKDDNSLTIDIPGSSMNFGAISLTSVTVVKGRPSTKDVIKVDCTMQHVDGRGGSSLELEDLISILDPQDPLAGCQKATNFAIPANTNVESFATRGEFNYQLQRNGDFDVLTDFFLDPVHNYMLPYGFEHLLSASFSVATQKLSLLARKDNEDYFSRHFLEFQFDQPKAAKQLGERAKIRGMNFAPNVITEEDSVRLHVQRSGDEWNVLAIAELRGTSTTPRTFKGLDGIQHFLTVENVDNVEIWGGDQADVFMLEGNEWITGELDGKGGQDVISLDFGYALNKLVAVDLFHGQMTIDDGRPGLTVKNFERFKGRLGSENILAGCDTQYIEGNGGEDVVIIPDLSSACSLDNEPKLKIKISSTPPTQVINCAKTGTFIYDMPETTSFDVQLSDSCSEDNGETVESESISRPNPSSNLSPNFNLNSNSDSESSSDFDSDFNSEADLDSSTDSDSDSNVNADLDSNSNSNPNSDFDSNPGVTHIYQFHYNLEEIQAIGFDDALHQITLTVEGAISRHRLLALPSDSQYYSQPKLLTADGVQILVFLTGSIHLVFSEPVDASHGVLTSRYGEIANRLQASMIFTTVEGEKVFIGDTSPFNLLSNNQQAPSHLVGGTGAATVFSIEPTAQPVTVVARGSGTSRLDLSKIVRPIRDELGTKFKPLTIEQGNDLIIDTGDVQVRIEDGVLTAPRLEIVLDSARLKLEPEDKSTEKTRRKREAESLENPDDSEYSGEGEGKVVGRKWEMVPIPIELSGEQLVFMSKDDLEDGVTVLFEPNSGKTGGAERRAQAAKRTQAVDDSFKVGKLDEGLLLTNTFEDGDLGEEQRSTLVIEDFYRTDTPLPQGVRFVLSREFEPLELDGIIEGEELTEVGTSLNWIIENPMEYILADPEPGGEIPSKGIDEWGTNMFGGTAEGDLFILEGK